MLLANPVCVGIDVGQIHDPTALAVSEVSQIDTGRLRFGPSPQPARLDIKSGTWIPAEDIYPVTVTEYTIRHIKRLPLGTSYPDVALHIADMLCSPLFAGRDVRVLIDVTGVGRPVYDDLDKEIRIRKYGIWNNDGTFQPGSRGEMARLVLKPITFSHGEKYNRSTGVLAKAFLVSRLQSLLQAGRVHGPDIPEMKATTDELKTYEIKVSDDGKDQYGGKIGKHDDLATALGLSCLEDPWSDKVSYSKRVY
jgi:hypothetical protein